MCVLLFVGVCVRVLVRGGETFSPGFCFLNMMLTHLLMHITFPHDPETLVCLIIVLLLIY